MRLEHNLELKQTQKLVMTQELRQAIELLQFNTIELNDYLKDQIEENPLLEMEKEEDLVEEGEEIQEDEEIDWEEYIGEYDDISYRQERDRNQEDYNLEAFTYYEQTLREYLNEQLKFIKLKDEEYLIGEYIIENIDNSGYLSTRVEEISKQLNIKKEKVEEILNVIQKFDPLGVGARNLEECLLLQIEGKKDINPKTRTIIKNHLEDIARNRIAKISRKLNIDRKEVQEICDLIKELEPKPGSNFSDKLDQARYIEADASIEWIDGEFIITINDNTGPRLNINNFYKNLLSKSSDKNAKDFLSERLNSAIWIIKSIEQRRQTIYSVVESILKFQYEFFKSGDSQKLVPLTLKEVAEDIDMHISTISRTTNGKHLQTPKGLFELKYFFTSRLAGSKKDSSSTSIKSLIRDLIDKEDPRKPYSDQKIADLLKEKEIKISRRTVAKYRGEMEIPSSTRRRRYD